MIVSGPFFRHDITGHRKHALWGSRSDRYSENFAGQETVQHGGRQRRGLFWVGKSPPFHRCAPSGRLGVCISCRRVSRVVLCPAAGSFCHRAKNYPWQPANIVNLFLPLWVPDLDLI